ERAYLLAHRIHDELWYAERFGCGWPRLEVPAGLATPFSPIDPSALEEFLDDLAASPSPKPKKDPYILLTGYWPPTNIGTENSGGEGIPQYGLLRDFIET